MQIYIKKGRMRSYPLRASQVDEMELARDGLHRAFRIGIAFLLFQDDREDGV